MPFGDKNDDITDIYRGLFPDIQSVDRRNGGTMAPNLTHKSDELVELVELPVKRGPGRPRKGDPPVIKVKRGPRAPPVTIDIEASS